MHVCVREWSSSTCTCVSESGAVVHARVCQGVEHTTVLSATRASFHDRSKTRFYCIATMCL